MRMQQNLASYEFVSYLFLLNSIAYADIIVLFCVDLCYVFQMRDELCSRPPFHILCIQDSIIRSWVSIAMSFLDFLFMQYYWFDFMYAHINISFSLYTYMGKLRLGNLQDYHSSLTFREDPLPFLRAANHFSTEYLFIGNISQEKLTRRANMSILLMLQQG